jgi:hypothetical protein
MTGRWRRSTTWTITVTDIGYGELRRARSSVLKQSGVLAPGRGSMDTTTPMVRLGLEVVEFDVEGAVRFAGEITGKNLYRIKVAKGNYAIDLFTAAICSGLSYGAAAEQRRS